MSKGLERRLELLKNRALSDLDSIPTIAISICEKSNEEVMEAYETIKQALDRLENLEKIFSDLKSMFEIKARFDEIECSADKCENCPLGIGDGICLKKNF